MEGLTRSVKKFGLWYSILVVKEKEFCIGVFENRVDADERLDKGMKLRQGGISGKAIKTLLNKQ